MIKRALLSRLKAFNDETKGTVSVEAVIMFPLLLWAFLAMFTFFDGYRQVSIGQKAAFTIADMISRETDALNDIYIDNALEMFEYLTTSTGQSELRVSIIYYDDTANEYYLGWSEARGGRTALTDAVLQSWGAVLPVLPESEALILVETWKAYVAPFNVGLVDRALETFIFASPRFASQLPFAL